MQEINNLEKKIVMRIFDVTEGRTHLGGCVETAALIRDENKSAMSISASPSLAPELSLELRLLLARQMLYHYPKSSPIPALQF